MKENWVCPNAEVQLFTPQEFVATCYKYTYNCLGNSQGRYLYRDKNSYVAELHAGSHVITISLKTNNSNNLPTITSGGTKDATNNGNTWHTENGYYFSFNGQYHFGTSPTFTPSGTTNAS